MTFIGVHFHRAVDPADIGAHHIHAHAPSRDVCNLFGRAESRLENQVDDLAAAPRGDLLRRDQTAGDCLGLDLLHGDTTAVIGNPDDNAVPLLSSLQPDRPLLELPGCPTFFRRFHAVINRVSDEMN